jgi:hypothetical protein
MKKIYWSKEDRTKVLIRAVEIRKQRLGLNLLECIRKAQTVLPHALHRPFKTHASCVDLTKELRTMAAKPEAPPVPPPTPEPPPAPRLSIEDLLERVAEEFADRLMLKLNVALKQRATAVLGHAALAITEADRVRKRRVLVIGPLDSQFAMLEKEFGKLLDLRLGRKDASAAALTSISTSADVVVLWVDFISHAVQDYVPKEKVVFVNGGMDALRAKLEEVYCL